MLHFLKCGFSQIRTYTIFQTQSSEGLRGLQPRNASHETGQIPAVLEGPGRSLDSPRGLLSPQMLMRMVRGVKTDFPARGTAQLSQFQNASGREGVGGGSLPQALP